MLAVRLEWEDLANRADCRASATFDWAHAGWFTVGRPRQRQLQVILVRKALRLVGVWPLVRHVDRLGAILMPLGSESSEYPDILAESGPTDMAIGNVAWQAAIGLGDLLIVRHVRQESLLDRVVRASRRVMTRHTIAASWTTFEPHYDIDVYRAGLSKHRRANLRRRRQTLARVGAVRFCLLSEPAERAKAVDWLLSRKQEWLRQTQRQNPWMGTPEYRDFLLCLARQDGPSARLRIFGLYLDGTLIAALLCSIDRKWLEFYLISHDPAWARYSAGTLLLANCMEWACSNRLLFDFRIGDEDYKSIWVNRGCTVTSYHVALTTRGMMPVLLEAARLSPEAGRRVARPWRAGLRAVFARRVKLAHAMLEPAVSRPAPDE